MIREIDRNAGSPSTPINMEPVSRRSTCNASELQTCPPMMVNRLHFQEQDHARLKKIHVEGTFESKVTKKISAKINRRSSSSPPGGGLPGFHTQPASLLTTFTVASRL